MSVRGWDDNEDSPEWLPPHVQGDWAGSEGLFTRAHIQGRSFSRAPSPVCSMIWECTGLHCITCSHRPVAFMYFRNSKRKNHLHTDVLKHVSLHCGASCLFQWNETKGFSELLAQIQFSSPGVVLFISLKATKPVFFSLIIKKHWDPG